MCLCTIVLMAYSMAVKPLAPKAGVALTPGAARLLDARRLQEDIANQSHEAHSAAEQAEAMTRDGIDCRAVWTHGRTRHGSMAA